MAVEINTSHKPNTSSVIIASAYFPGEECEAPPPEVQKLTEYCKRQKKELILACDANAHNEVWGSTDTNKRGESLFDFLLQEQLEVYNRGTVPTFVTKVRKEVLDITFGTLVADTMLKNWRVADEETLSDHRMITFDLFGETKKEPMSRNPRKTDWGEYRRCLETSVRPQGSSPQLSL